MHGVEHPIFLIVDGHPSHRTKMTKCLVESLVWRHVKRHDRGGLFFDAVGETRMRIGILDCGTVARALVDGHLAEIAAAARSQSLRGASQR